MYIKCLKANTKKMLKSLTEIECKTSRLVEKKKLVKKKETSREDINSIEVNVLVCSSCHTKYHRQDGLNNTN